MSIKYVASYELEIDEKKIPNDIKNIQDVNKRKEKILEFVTDDKSPYFNTLVEDIPANMDQEIKLKENKCRTF